MVIILSAIPHCLNMREISTPNANSRTKLSIFGKNPKNWDLIQQPSIRKLDKNDILSTNYFVNLENDNL